MMFTQYFTPVRGGIYSPLWNNVPRRYTRAYYSVPVGVVLLLFCLFISQRSPSVVLRPGEVVASGREVFPEDDKSPFAHEPKGLGTLRDVREERFYLGGVSTLEEEQRRSVIYDPYPSYNEPEWRHKFIGNHRPCQGPARNLLSRNSAHDMVSVYPGVPKEFPPSLVGSYSATGLDGSVCVDRQSRLRPYGYGDQPHTIPHPKRLAAVQWDDANWGVLQTQCYLRNKDRYEVSHASQDYTLHALPQKPPGSADAFQEKPRSSNPSGQQPKSRSAVILRAWHDMDWSENTKQHVRSLIMELSLHSGGEYEVFILSHIRDKSISLSHADDEYILKLKDRFIPREFHNITVFFNDQILESWYPNIEEHSTILQYWQPVQAFSQSHDGFNFYWQLEMDSRFTAHSYHFLEKAAQFAKVQPRKYLWERNAYLYVPGSHGTWKQFSDMVTSSMRGHKSIWGPVTGTEGMPKNPLGPQPPVKSPNDDNFEWGVGEEADFISFSPIFDPINTEWPFSKNIWGLPESIPRRASGVAMGRVSRTILQGLHKAQAEENIGLASEMTIPTFALWHGLKAVHFPHPIYIDGKWTSQELGRILNPGPPDRINGDMSSIWNVHHMWDRILFRFSYLYTSQTAEDFYRRWLGYKIDPNQYTDGSIHQDPQGLNWFDGGHLREDLYGALCLPPMLLHPIKNTDPKKGPGMAVPV